MTHRPVRRPSPALLVAFVALCVALSGTSYGQDAVTAAKKLITGKRIATGAIKSRQVKDGSLRAADFAAGALPAGPKGDKGDPGPSTGPAGGDLAGTYPDPTLAPGAVGPDELGAIPAVRLRKSAAQNMPSSVTTDVVWDTEDYDGAGMHQGSEATVTVPRDGLYSISAVIEWSGNSTGRRILTILGGDTVLARDSRPPVATFLTAQNLTTVTRLTAGQAVRVTGDQDSGAPLDATAHAAAPSVLTVTYLGSGG